MNSITSIQDNNNNINVRLFILDPLSVIVKLAILSNKSIGTKLLIQNNVIYFQEPGPFQSFCRMFYKSNKTDLQYMYNPINIACSHFLSKDFVAKTPRIKHLFICAQKGLKNLMETYKNCSILNLIQSQTNESKTSGTSLCFIPCKSNLILPLFLLS